MTIDSAHVGRNYTSCSSSRRSRHTRRRRVRHVMFIYTPERRATAESTNRIVLRTLHWTLLWNVSTYSSSSAEDRLQRGSADVQSLQHIDAVVRPSPNPGSTTRPQPAIDHYDAVSTFHDDDFCETRFSMLCTSCLELTTENCFH